MSSEVLKLKKDFIDFYNEARELFVNVPPGCPREIPEALYKKPDSNQSGTYFIFTPTNEITGLKFNDDVIMHTRPTFPRNLGKKSNSVHNKITVNTACLVFQEFLKSPKEWKPTLLHEMVHIKDVMIKDMGFENRVTQKLDDSKALDWIVDRSEPNGHHNRRFWILCYYLAKSLLQEKKILKKILKGKEIDGVDPRQKVKWLTMKIYSNDPALMKFYLKNRNGRK